MWNTSYEHEINFSVAKMVTTTRTQNNTTGAQTDRQEYTKMFPNSHFHMENAWTLLEAEQWLGCCVTDDLDKVSAKTPKSKHYKGRSGHPSLIFKTFHFSLIRNSCFSRPKCTIESLF